MKITKIAALSLGLLALPSAMFADSYLIDSPRQIKPGVVNAIVAPLLLPIAAATATLRVDLTAETLARRAADAAIGVTTGTLRTDLSAEAITRAAKDAEIAVDTTTMVINFSAWASDVTQDTTSIKTLLDAVVLSTGAFGGASLINPNTFLSSQTILNNDGLFINTALSESVTIGDWLGAGTAVSMVSTNPMIYGFDESAAPFTNGGMFGYNVPAVSTGVALAFFEGLVGHSPDILLDNSGASFIYNNHAFGVGVWPSPVDTGLHVAPNFKYVDGNEGAGKILTSDASGNATWQTPAGGASLNSTNTWTAQQIITSTDGILTDFGAGKGLATIFAPDIGGGVRGPMMALVNNNAYSFGGIAITTSALPGDIGASILSMISLGISGSYRFQAYDGPTKNILESGIAGSGSGAYIIGASQAGTVPHFKLDATGDSMIGGNNAYGLTIGSTTVTAGYRLDVTGKSLFQGDVVSTGAITAQNGFVMGSVDVSSVSADAVTDTTLTVTCTGGKKVLNGGCQTAPATTVTQFYKSAADAWTCVTSAVTQITATATCVLKD